jgi:phage baseplate assembly protein V
MSQAEPKPAWRRGIVIAVDGAKAKLRVRLPDEDNIITDWLPMAVPFALGAKVYWLPRVSSQVVVLLDENGEDGIVLGALYSTPDPAPVSDPKLFYVETEDGTKIKVDPTASTVLIDTPGDVTVHAGRSITATAGQNIDATATGHINATCATAQVQASGRVDLKAPITRVSGLLQVDGPLLANGGIGVGNEALDSNGSVPGKLRVQGTIKSDTDLLSVGRSFNAHTHTAQGSNAVTTVPN